MIVPPDQRMKLPGRAGYEIDLVSAAAPARSLCAIR